MNTDSYIIAAAGGLDEQLPQQAGNAERIENWRIDRRSGGWSSRLGYEPYRPGLKGDWAPFTSDGAIYGLHCAQHLAGGARESILYCEDGNLHLLYEAGSTTGAPVQITLQSGRSIPAPTEPGPSFLDTPHGTVVCNGYDRPVLVNPWPLGTQAQAASAVSYIIRQLGFDGSPPAPQPRRVQPMPDATTGIASSTSTGGGAVTLWCLADAEAISDGGRWGLGFENNQTGSPGKKCTVGYSISNILSSGSESARSPIASTSWELPDTAEGFRYAVALDVPTGSPGTVARKIYRTANYSEDSPTPDDTTQYFVGLIRNNTDTLYFDAVSSAALGEPAPIIDAGVFPAPRARFPAMYKQCLFLDGGVDDPYTLYYSAPSRIEQFSSLQSLELGSEAGGITALYGDYTLLIVFRERGIDVVQGDYVAGFTVSSIDRTLQCRAPHSVQRVPGLGLVFLAADGVYALTGGLQGGAVVDMIKLSQGWDDTISRITQDCQPKAVSAYAATDREYHLYVPVDGNDRPNLGLVLHIDKLQRSPDVSAWSVRKGFPVGCLATTQSGALLFGHNTGNETGNSSSERGIFVISGRHYLGGTVPIPDTFTLGPATGSLYRSAWNDFGDPQILKQIQYVTVWVMTTGNPEITLRWYKDFNLTATTERTYTMQPPDQSTLAVYGRAVLDAAGTAYRNERLVPLRYAVAVQSCSHFAFEIETTTDIVLVGFEYGYTVRGTDVVRGRRA
jgi:hypothetical protein